MLVSGKLQGLVTKRPVFYIGWRNVRFYYWVTKRPVTKRPVTKRPGAEWNYVHKKKFVVVKDDFLIQSQWIFYRQIWVEKAGLQFLLADLNKLNDAMDATWAICSFWVHREVTNIQKFCLNFKV